MKQNISYRKFKKKKKKNCRLFDKGQCIFALLFIGCIKSELNVASVKFIFSVHESLYTSNPVSPV